MLADHVLYSMFDLISRIAYILTSAGTCMNAYVYTYVKHCFFI